MKTNWSTKKLGEIAVEIIGGGTPRRNVSEYWNGDIPWMTVEDINDHFYIQETKQFISQKGLENSNAKLIPSGSVILSCTASVGNVAINKISLTTNQQFNSFVCKKEIVPEFLAYFLIFQKRKIEKLGGITTFPFISKGLISNLKISLPPLKIQKQIVEKLDKIAEARKLNDELIQKTDELFQSLLHQELNPAGKDWEENKFISCIEKNPLKIKGISRDKYQNIGKFPIIDQSEKFIVGYTDDESKVYKISSPVIIFGDHTRIFKYIDFNFAIGADGTQIIIPISKIIIPKFFYFQMLNLKINNLGYSRHFKILKTKKIIIPPLKTQKQIVAKLSAVQDYKKQLLEQKVKLKELFDSALCKSMR